MVTLRVRTIAYEDRQVDVSDVMGLQAAAERMGVSLQTVINLVNRGKLTELIDVDSIHAFRDRRFVLRSEVEEMAARRARAASKWVGEAVD